MGVERAVTRWYARHQAVQIEIATLRTRLEQLQAKRSEQSIEDAELLEVEQQLAGAQARLHALGPCPRPMMG